MKKLHRKIIVGLFMLAPLAIPADIFAQDSTVHSLNMDLSYFLSEANTPTLRVQTRTKEGKRFQPVAGIAVDLFFGSGDGKIALGKVVTGQDGFAWKSIPASIKGAWDSAATLDFSAASAALKPYPATDAEVSVTRAKLNIDTARDGDTRNIVVTVLEKKGANWTPVKGVDLKVYVKRLLGDLPVSDEESFTTDSLGQVTAEFKRDSLKGNEKGELTLVAKVEDNEAYGNLAATKMVNWGKAFTPTDNFNDRTLWATRNKAPLWLLGLASLIIILVWGVIIYLVTQIVKIRKIGITGSDTI